MELLVKYILIMN